MANLKNQKLFNNSNVGSRRATMNKLYSDEEYGITQSERDCQVRQLVALIIIYLMYLCSIGIVIQEIVVSQQVNDIAPIFQKTYRYVVVITYLGFMAMLCLLKTLFYMYRITVWRNKKIDPIQMYARTRFFIMVFLSVSEIILLALGLIIYVMTPHELSRIKGIMSNERHVSNIS